MTMKVSPTEKPLKHHDFMTSTGFYIRSSLREARRRKLYFCLAISSTFIVVAATAVSQTIMDYTPLIFLKASEADTGSIDVQLDCVSQTFRENDGVTTKDVTKNLLFNTTAIEAQVNPMFPQATTPRYTFSASVANVAGSCTGSTVCYTAQFVLQDTVRETQLGMATDPSLPQAIPYGGLVMSSKFARAIQVGVGSIVHMHIYVGELLREVAVQFNSKQATKPEMIPESTFAGPASNITIPFRVERVVDSMSGKYPDGTNDAIITEYEYFFQVLSSHMPVISNINYAKFTAYVRNENPKHYAQQMLFNIKDRMEAYRNSNFDLIQDKVTSFGSKISNALGVFPYEMSTPVFTKLSDLKFAGLFLGIVLTIIIVVLFILSTILIYNLLLVTVETKSFEFGVIRMLGLTKFGIGQLILVQALLFALPGLFLGLLLSVPLLKVLGGVLGKMLTITIPIIPSGVAIFWSVLIGTLIPIISSYYPMKEALGKNLNLSLDLVHSKTNSVQISIEVGSKRFPWTEITFGVLTVAFGIGIYIVLPLSLISFQLGLLLSMFFVILIGLLVGLTILSMNFQHLMAQLVTTICFFWTSASFKSLILKNLLAHKLRNRQTAIMYSLALGFIIFILVSLNQELTSMAYQVQARRGALIEFKNVGQGLDTKRLDDLMATTLSNVVESYTYISFDLTSIVKSWGAYNAVTLTHKGQLYEYNPTVRAVAPNIFKTTVDGFLVTTKADETTGLDLGEQLYTPRGTQGVIVGETYRDRLGVTNDIDSSLILKLENGANSYSEELRVIAALESSPVFRFSKLPGVNAQDVLVSFPTFARLGGTVMNGVNAIPVEKMLVKVKGDSNANLDAVFFELNKLRQADSNLRLWDFRDTQKRITSNQNTLNFLFKAVEVIVMLLTMFSLITSMSTNIMEQTKEIAVLRAIGLTKLKVNLLYVSEAFVLIISSAIFGIIIGTAVAWTLSLQRVLFTQLPMIFTFPGGDLIVIFSVAAFSAFVSSYFPARKVTKHQISKIIRLGG